MRPRRSLPTRQTPCQVQGLVMRRATARRQQAPGSPGPNGSARWNFRTAERARGPEPGSFLRGSNDPDLGVPQSTAPSRPLRGRTLGASEAQARPVPVRGRPRARSFAARFGRPNEGRSESPFEPIRHRATGNQPLGSTALGACRITDQLLTCRLRRRVSDQSSRAVARRQEPGSFPDRGKFARRRPGTQTKLSVRCSSLLCGVPADLECNPR